jgi:hypothetical protein
MSVTPSRWRNRTYVAVIAAVAVPWVVFVGYVAWNHFGATMDWVEGQNEWLQELFGGLLVLGWTAFLLVGVLAGGLLADHTAGTRYLSNAPAQTHGNHAAWRRPDRS